uniref:Uncharacterized protein n=1 Tax=Lepeophtheirus salmonis TaxID=72036 RepID=A0A0K2VAL7_LEPSM
MKAQPDTGAIECIISHDLLLEYNIEIDSTKRLSILVAKSSSLRCNGAVCLRIKIEEVSGTDITAYVTLDLQDDLIASWHGLQKRRIIPEYFPQVIEVSPNESIIRKTV